MSDTKTVTDDVADAVSADGWLAAPAASPDQMFGSVTIDQALRNAGTGGRGIQFVDRSLNADPRTYEELVSSCRRAASDLRTRGVERGDAVCLLGPTTPGMVVALFALWWIGAVPVVLPLPRRATDLGEYLEDLGSRIRLTDARVVLAAAEFVDASRTIEPGFELVPIDDVATSNLEPAQPVDVAPSDVALLQFTSGTTGPSRAVVLTHETIMGNLAAIARASKCHPDRDSYVSWLPLFHDLGLIGMLLGAVTLGMDLVLIPTQEFLARPACWMEAVSAYSATFTAAPSFGYGLAARHLEQQPEGIELSQVRVFANGGEPIDFAVVDRFLTAAAPYGAQRDDMCPVYGLAEATLAVSVKRLHQPLAALPVSRAMIEREGRVSPPEDEGDTRLIISCGTPIPGTRVSIRGGDGGALGDDRVGEVMVQARSLMRGYLGRDGVDGIALSEGWLPTGDLGFVHDGQLYVCGRAKDVIMFGGRCLHAEDYEYWAERCEGVRAGNAIAFARSGEEQMVVVVEARPDTDPEQLAITLADRLRRKLPRGAHEVVVVDTGSLPKTTSGKRQRQRCRELHAAGALPVRASTTLIGKGDPA